jgi:hypothetical protein
LRKHRDGVARQQEDAIHTGQGERECLWVVQI